MKRTCGRLGAKQIWLASHSRASLCHEKNTVWPTQPHLSDQTTSTPPHLDHSMASNRSCGWNICTWTPKRRWTLSRPGNTGVARSKCEEPWCTRIYLDLKLLLLLLLLLPAQNPSPGPLRNLKLAEDPIAFCCRGNSFSGDFSCCARLPPKLELPRSPNIALAANVIFPFLIFQMRARLPPRVELPVSPHTAPATKKM